MSLRLDTLRHGMSDTQGAAIRRDSPDSAINVSHKFDHSPNNCCAEGRIWSELFFQAG
jgi:hypothetical protein